MCNEITLLLNNWELFKIKWKKDTEGEISFLEGDIFIKILKSM